MTFRGRYEEEIEVLKEKELLEVMVVVLSVEIVIITQQVVLKREVAPLLRHQVLIP